MDITKFHISIFKTQRLIPKETAKVAIISYILVLTLKHTITSNSNKSNRMVTTSIYFSNIIKIFQVIIHRETRFRRGASKKI